MMKYQVRNTDQALAYIADCTLATVQDLAMKKRRSNTEYERQIGIAQAVCDWMKDFNIDSKTTRAEDIIGICTVKEWADKYDVKKENI